MSVILFHGLSKVLAQCILIHRSVLARRQCNIYSLPLATSEPYGKPPPESLKRIESTDAMKQVNRLDRRGYTTLIIADGARCCNPLAKKNKLLVRECNHSRGQFSIWRWFRNRGRVRIQTGGIDSFWAILKNGIPPSWRSNVNGRANPTLWLYAGWAHWRWESDTANLMNKIRHTLRQVWRWKWWKWIRIIFDHKVL